MKESSNLGSFLDSMQKTAYTVLFSGLNSPIQVKISGTYVKLFFIDLFMGLGSLLFDRKTPKQNYENANMQIGFYAMQRVDAII